MIKKLELKHLKGYLGTGLIIETQFVNGGIGTVGFEKEMTLFNCHKVDGIKIKPKFHPLSDLTKPCLEGGKIPIVELAKMQEDEPIKINKIDDEGEHFHVFYEINHDNKVSFSFHSNIHSFTTKMEYTSFSHTMVTVNQLELFEKLFEWHFDIYGLIGSGLAIDINTL